MASLSEMWATRSPSQQRDWFAGLCGPHEGQACLHPCAPVARPASRDGGHTGPCTRSSPAVPVLSSPLFNKGPGLWEVGILLLLQAVTFC